jgi:hypothetical protein
MRKLFFLIEWVSSSPPENLRNLRTYTTYANY